MPRNKEKEAGFEESLASLERIVAQLESGELPLERALELFQDGVELSRRCQSQLEESERKVEILLRERGEIKLGPFDGQREKPFAEAERKPAMPIAAKASDDDDDGDDFDDSIPF